MAYEWDTLGYLKRYYDNKVNTKLSQKLIRNVPDKTLGFFWGKSCTNPQNNYSHRNKKCVQIGIVDQNEFDALARELSPDLRGIFFFKCPKISDYSALENFPKLTCVKGYWNPSLKTLWNASKTPKVREIDLTDYGKLDCAAFADFTNLRYLSYSGATTIKSFDFLYKLTKLRQLWLNIKALNNDIRPILSLKKLKNYYVGDKNHVYIKNYLEHGTLPPPSKPSIYDGMPTRDWLENESTEMTKKQLKQIERILADYIRTLAAADSAAAAADGAICCVTKLNEFSAYIETVEREELFDFLLGKAKEEWYDDIVAAIENTRDW